MRNKRSIRHRVRRPKIPLLELDITSLLDILVIMLVFLLKSYNASGIIVNVSDDITLPVSETQDLNSSGVIVQVSPTKIWVDDKIVLDMQSPPPRIFDHVGKKRIIPLYEALVSKRETVKRVEKAAPAAKPFSGVVNFVVDRTIGYNYLRKLMYTCAEAGFVKYKFVVLGVE